MRNLDQNRIGLSFSLALLLLLPVLGCGKPKPDAELATFVPKRGLSGAPITSEEADQFAAQYEKALADRDMATLLRLFQPDSFADRILEGLPIPEKQVANAKAGLKSGFNSLYADLMGLKSPENEYIYLRSREKEGQQELIFRLSMGDTFNYHIILLNRNVDQSIFIEDIYVVAAGEYMSDSVRNLFAQLIPGLSAGIINRIDGTTKQAEKDIDTMKKLASMLKNPAVNYDQCLAEYQKLSKAFQQAKPIMIMMIMKAGENPDNPAYLEKMSEFQRLFPDDPAAGIIAIDYYYLKDDLVNVIKSIDKVNELIGGDPYLEIMKASIRIENNIQIEEGVRDIENAIQDYPDMLGVYLTKAMIIVVAGDFDATTIAFQELVEKFDYELNFKDIKEDKIFQDYVKSEEYRKLVDWYLKRD